MRELSWRQEGDGAWVIRGRLGQEQGALVVNALNGVMDEWRAEAAGEAEEVSAEMPDGVDLCLPLPTRIDNLRADALERLARGYAAGAGRPGLPGGGDQYTIHLHTDADTLREVGACAHAESETGRLVCAETTRRMACDSAVVHWLDGGSSPPAGAGSSETLNIGRKSRTVPPAIRRALKRRDRGCRFPGCSAHRFVDAHHIVHWADGGETSLSNLVLLCRRHHRLVHEGGFGVCNDGVHGMRFRYPDGRSVPESVDGRFRGNAGEIVRCNVELGLDIHSETPIPGWDGQAIDYCTAVQGLMMADSGHRPIW